MSTSVLANRPFKSRTSEPKPIITEPAWRRLAEHSLEMANVNMRTLFASDADRATRMTVETVGLYLDYSKNLVTGETLTMLVELANNAGLRDRIEAMFRGEKIDSVPSCL
jgi:glucose-6-phosphate isomerase